MAKGGTSRKRKGTGKPKAGRATTRKGRPGDAGRGPGSELRRQRFETLLPPLLREHDIDLWLMYAREGARDPLGPDIGLGDVVARGAALVGWRAGRFTAEAICASYDVTPIEETGLYERITPYRAEGIGPALRKAIESWQPRTIALDVSRDLPMADGLTHGMRAHLEEILGPAWAARFRSAEALAVAFRSSRLAAEHALIEKAVLATHRLQKAALTADVIRPGRTTERAVGAFLREKAEALGFRIPFLAVVAGPTRGHSEPTDRVIVRGDAVRIDFGLTWKGYNSDIQRSAYVRRPGESGPPEFLARLWETALAANRAAIAAMKPGVRAADVDGAARAIVRGAGYAEYPHATGHTLGTDVHDLGPVLGPDWPERYGSSVHYALRAGQVFAVEPAAYAPDPGGAGEISWGLEENVVVEESGARVIGRAQERLYLI